jgi:hypothetical protein
MSRRAYDETDFSLEDLEDVAQQLHPDLTRSEREELLYGQEDLNEEWI